MGWKGTGKYICSGCKKKGIINPLTKDNCAPSVFKRRLGLCRDCKKKESSDWNEKNKTRRKEIANKYRQQNGTVVTQAARAYHRSFKGKHKALVSKIRREGIPSNDPILNLNFYIELIRDNECHYCLGSLNPTSHSLDAMDNKVGHRCFNVVPCCRSCNQKKMNDMTYEEMMLLAPALREIRRRRETANVGASLCNLLSSA